MKRYSSEIGSQWVIQQCSPAMNHSLITAEFTMAEVAAALAAKQRAPKGITLAQRDAAMSVFLSDCNQQYRLIAVERRIIERAIDLTQRHRLRGYDAIHLATAIEANLRLRWAGLSTLICVAADDDLLAAAGAEGLLTENPNHHP
ncbi:MAG: type II toxin-antitoxin system VapC family toxin [Caldilineales bacterium]|nr:type II toxin-antitoxin system VapC family toxin [Caldilineales bacterium]